VLDGVLWRTHAGSPWWDLLSEYCHWKIIYHRHRRWCADGIWARVLDELRRGGDQSAEGPCGSGWSGGGGRCCTEGRSRPLTRHTEQRRVGASTTSRMPPDMMRRAADRRSGSTPVVVEKHSQSATGQLAANRSPSRSASCRSRMGRRLRGRGRRCVGTGVVPADIGTHLPFFSRSAVDRGSRRR
jgi:transposase